MPPRKKKQLPPPEVTPAPPPASPEPPAPEPVRSPVAPIDGPDVRSAPPRMWPPDPFVLMTVTLGTERHSPRMRLYRSNKLNQMAIGFDARPEKEYRERLRENGWRWREDEGVWTKQLDRERRAVGHLEAERLFTAIGAAIRGDLGLEQQVVGR